MPKLLPASFLAVLALSLAACTNVSWGDGEAVEGSGTSSSRTVEVSGIRSVSLATPGTLVITQGAAPLVIEGDDNLIDRVQAEVRNGTLQIGTERGVSLRPRSDLRYTVGVDRLEGIEVAGSGRIEARGAQAETVTVEIAGSGGADVADIRAEAVRIRMAGSGGVTVAGQTTRLSVEVAGSGDVEASDLAADQAEVEIAGSGDVTLRAEKTLDAQIMGSGDVRYAGSPEVSRQVMGSGSVTRADG